MMPTAADSCLTDARCHTFFEASDENESSADEKLITVDGFFDSGYKKMYDLRCQGLLCDVVLIAQGKQLVAHKLVLAASIPYFRVMFSFDYKERHSNEFNFDIFSYNSLEAVISFAYTGRITVCETSVTKIIKVAAYLQMDSLLDACEKYICQKLTNYDLNDLFELAESCHLKNLNEAILNFGAKYFMRESGREEFLLLNKEKLTNLLKDDKLLITSECIAFDTLKRWVEADEATRAPHFRSMLSTVRLPLMSDSCLANLVRNDELIQKYAGDLDLSSFASGHRPNEDEALAALEGFNARPRSLQLANKCLYIGGGITNDTVPTDLFKLCVPYEAYKFSHNQLSFVNSLAQWEALPNWNVFRYRFGMVSVLDRIFAIGGHMNHCSHLVNMYNVATEEFVTVAPLLQARDVMATAVCGQRIYVLGGRSHMDPLNSTEVFHVDENRWIASRPLPKKRYGSSSLYLNGRIYLIGGCDGNGETASMYACDMRLGNWELLKKMDRPRRAFGAAVYNDRICVVGGWSRGESIAHAELYEPRMNCWLPFPRLLTPRGGVPLAAMNGSLFACGGYDGNTMLISVEVFEPNLGQWVFGPAIRFGRGMFSASVVHTIP